MVSADFPVVDLEGNQRESVDGKVSEFLCDGISLSAGLVRCKVLIL